MSMTLAYIINIVILVIGVVVFVIGLILTTISSNKKKEYDGFLLALAGLAVILGGVWLSASLKDRQQSVAKAEQEAYNAAHPAYTYEIEDDYVQVNTEDSRHVKYYYDNIIDSMNFNGGLTVVEFCKELEDKGYTLLEKKSEAYIVP